MTTVLGFFGCSSAVKLPTPDAVRHNRSMDATKAFEAFVVLFRPQKRKATFRAYWSVLAGSIFQRLILCMATGTDQVCLALLLRSVHLIHVHVSKAGFTHKGALNKGYLRCFVCGLPTMPRKKLKWSGLDRDRLMVIVQDWMSSLALSRKV